jgi:hypothetical protein
MEITGIGYLGFESPNHKAMAEVGPQVFGFGIDTSRNDDIVYLRMDERFFRIAIHPGQSDRLAYMGFEVRTRVLWEQAVETLRRHGVDVAVGDTELAEQRGVTGVASFSDPAGWRMEIFHGQWFRPRSFLPGRPHSGFFDTEHYGIGHMIVPSGCKDQCDQFVEQVLGFNVFEGFLLPGASAFRTKLNPLSHNFGYQTLPTHELGDTNVGQGGFHIGIYNNDFQDVAVAFDLAREADLQVAGGLIMPAFDPAIMLNVMTPAGFPIQYHSPPQLFPHDTYVERVPQPGHPLVWGGFGMIPRTPRT